jgi:hypothetical protein
MTEASRTNLVWPTECKHVRAGELEAVETVQGRLTMTLTAATLPGRDADFRYTKGPDTMRLCAFCAGVLWSTVLDMSEGKAPRR